NMLNVKPGDTMTVSKIGDYSAPQTGDAATPSLTWTVGVVNPPAAPLGFLGRTTPLVIPELIVSDAVFDGLSAQLQQLGPINPGAMYIQSSGDTSAAVEAIRRVYQSTVGGNLSYFS